MIEVRHNDDGSIDEIVGRNCYFHLEQMNDGEWHLVISGNQGHDPRKDFALFTQGHIRPKLIVKET